MSKESLSKSSGTKTASYVVILANGTFPSTPNARSFFYRAARLICCDGAVEKACENGREPDFIVGDCDSIPSKFAERFRDRLIRVSEQDTNDLAKAFRFCVAKNWRNIVILGATGAREDHAIANVSYLVDFSSQADSVEMVTDEGVFRAIRRPCWIDTVPGQQISIFSMDPRQKITSEGLKYPLNKLCLSRWYKATLNESLASRIYLEFDGSTPLLLFLVNAN